MTRNVPRSTASAGADARHPGEATLEMWAPLFSGLNAWNGKCAEAAAAVNREWVEFLGRRLKEDFALPVHLAACRGPEDVWRTYAEFLQKMNTDYQGELTELTKLGSAMAQQNMGALQATIDNSSEERRAGEAA